MSNHPEATILLQKSKTKADLEHQFNKLRPSSFEYLFIAIAFPMWMLVMHQFANTMSSELFINLLYFTPLLTYVCAIYININKRIDAMYKLLTKYPQENINN